MLFLVCSVIVLLVLVGRFSIMLLTPTVAPIVEPTPSGHITVDLEVDQFVCLVINKYIISFSIKGEAFD